MLRVWYVQTMPCDVCNECVTSLPLTAPHHLPLKMAARMHGMKRNPNLNAKTAATSDAGQRHCYRCWAAGGQRLPAAAAACPRCAVRAACTRQLTLLFAELPCSRPPRLHCETQPLRKADILTAYGRNKRAATVETGVGFKAVQQAYSVMTCNFLANAHNVQGNMHLVSVDTGQRPVGDSNLSNGYVQLMYSPSRRCGSRSLSTG